MGEAIVTLVGRYRERTTANCDRAITTLLTPRAQLGIPDKDEYLAPPGRDTRHGAPGPPVALCGKGDT